MPDNATTAAAEAAPVAHETVPEQIETPAIFVFVFGVPVFMVVLWFMVRIFTGRWITDPAPPLIPLPPGPDVDPTTDALADDETTS